MSSAFKIIDFKLKKMKQFSCKKGFILLVVLTISTFVRAEKAYQKTFYDNGILKAEGWIENNQKTNYWKYYYNDGSIKKEGHFLNGKQTKYWYFYRKNGTKESEGHFFNGKKNKWWLFYDNKEFINHKCQLKNNQKNGYCFFYENKKLIKAEKYKSGKKINEWNDFEAFKKENNLSDLK